MRRVGNVKPGPLCRLWCKLSIGANVAGTVRRKVHRGTAAFSVFLMHLAGGRICFSTFEPRGGDWCTRITRVRRSAVVARGGLEATTLLSVAGGASGRELLPRCYQTIPNDADLRRTPSIPGLEIFYLYIGVILGGNTLVTTLNQRVHGSSP